MRQNALNHKQFNSHTGEELVRFGIQLFFQQSIRGKKMKVAVMGCVVNGPGEAKEADIGIAGGKGVGLLIKKGEIIKKVPEDQLLETLRDELLHWNA